MAGLRAALDEPSQVSEAGNVVIVLMLISYGVIAWASWRRGKVVERNHLIAFPIVGAVFDIILIFIPLVPTVMNVLALVFGMMEKSQRA